MKTKYINIIKSNMDKIGIAIDCSRYEESYSGYYDSRNWFMEFNDGRINVDTYLNGLSEDKLKLMADNALK